MDCPAKALCNGKFHSRDVDHGSTRQRFVIHLCRARTEHQEGDTQLSEMQLSVGDG